MIDEIIKNLLWLGYGHGCTPDMAFAVAQSQGLFRVTKYLIFTVSTVISWAGALGQ